MHVTLISYTPDPEKITDTAAKLCYSSSDIDSIMKGFTPEKTKSFIDMLVSIGHESVMEHVNFTFGIEGISRTCSHQLVRHRIASYSHKSQRYVNEHEFKFITPPEIASIPKAKEEFEQAINILIKSYTKIAALLTKKHKNQLMSEGLNEKNAISKAYKLANEDARFILPNACETKIIVTMNVRSIFNFFRHRCCNRAQWEIRKVANEMLRLCFRVSPNIFKYAGPLCVIDGKCPEGKMSCGKIKEVTAYFEDLKKQNL